MKEESSFDGSFQRVGAAENRQPEIKMKFPLELSAERLKQVGETGIFRRYQEGDMNTYPFQGGSATINPGGTASNPRPDRDRGFFYYPVPASRIHPALNTGMLPSAVRKDDCIDISQSWTSPEVKPGGTAG